MYIRTLLNTTRFKVMIVMNLSELCCEVCFSESSTRMDDLLVSLVRESQKQKLLCHWGGSLHIHSHIGATTTRISPWGVHTISMFSIYTLVHDCFIVLRMLL